MKRVSIITVTYRPPAQPPPARPFSLSGGWVEIWEHGRYLGLIVGLDRLERFVLERAPRVFVVRFVQREACCGQLLPIGAFAAEAAADGKTVRFFPLDQMRPKKGGKP